MSSLTLKVFLPNGADIMTQKGESTINLKAYEIDQLEVLEELSLQEFGNDMEFKVKDGQYVNKGDVILTCGFLHHNILLSDKSGIIEIGNEVVRILGQKHHIEKRINFDGKVITIIPDKFIEIKCKVKSIKPLYYYNTKRKLTDIIYIESKKALIKDRLLQLSTSNSTLVLNDNIYPDELAKLIAIGAKRIIVNGLILDDLNVLKNEISKLDGFAIIGGFGEHLEKSYDFITTNFDLLWGKNKVFTGNKIVRNNNKTIYQHPFWGSTFRYGIQNGHIGELEYNDKSIEFYLKNLQENNE